MTTTTRLNDTLALQHARAVASRFGLHQGMAVFRDHQTHGRQIGVVVLVIGSVRDDAVKIRVGDQFWSAEPFMGWRPVTLETFGPGAAEAITDHAL